MRPVRARLLVPERALFDVGVLRQQALANREHPSRPIAHHGNQIDLVLGVEPLEHLLVHRVQQQHVGLLHLVQVHVGQDGLGEERELHLAA